MALSLRKRPEPPAAGQARPRSRPRLVASPGKVTTLREASPRWWRRPRALYTVLTVASGGLVIAGVAMVYLPLAMVLAGVCGGALGLIGLGLLQRGSPR